MSPAGLATTLPILIEPALRYGPMRELSRYAGRSLGTIHRVQLALRDLPLLDGGPESSALWRNLFTAWCIAYDAGREKRIIGRYSSDLSTAEAAAALSSPGLIAASGESAAHLLGYDIRPEMFHGYVAQEEPLGPVIKAARLRKDPQG